MTQKVKISRSDFDFYPISSGAYIVGYQSPVTGNIWVARVECMLYVDAVKYTDKPKIKDLNVLKRYIKDNFFKYVKYDK